MAETILLEDEFSDKCLKVGDIIWYVNNDINIPTLYPHPHVIIAIYEEWIYTVCGTSKQETIERKAKNLNHTDYSFFPAVRKSKANGLSEEHTFFDCCDYYDIHRHDLQDKYQNGELVMKSGKITYAEYNQIRIALKSNPKTDIIDLLIHSDD